MNELQYRVNFFLQLLQSLISLGVGLVGLSLVFEHTTSLAGWSRPELLAVMGVYTLMGGIINATIQPNMNRLLGDVQEGSLDFALTKPVDSQLIISVRDFRIWRLVDVVVGAIVLGWAVVELRVTIGLGQSLAFATALLLGSLMIYSFWLILATGRILGGAHGSDRGALPGHLPGRALAGGYLPRLAAERADLPGADRFRGDCAGRSLDQPHGGFHAVINRRGRYRLPGFFSLVLPQGIKELHGRFCLISHLLINRAGYTENQFNRSQTNDSIRQVSSARVFLACVFSALGAAGLQFAAGPGLYSDHPARKWSSHHHERCHFSPRPRVLPRS